MRSETDTTQVPCPLRAAAIASPDAPAIVGAGGILTYGELERRVSATAALLRELGCQPGERVALYLPKDGQYLALLLALMRAGCVACPLSTRLPPRGVAPLLQRAACKALISSDEGLFGAVSADLQKLRPEALIEANPAEAKDAEPPQLPLDRPATIVFTSGSTGSPKAALHTFGNHYFSALGSNRNIVPTPGDRWLHSLPIYHVGGLSIVFRCLLAGAAIALPEPGESPGRAISRYGATHVSLVATQLRRLLEEDEPALGGLKAILLGGGPVPASLLDEALARKLPVHTSYGLTEMASQVTATPPDATHAELHTSGRVLPHREISVQKDGEILVRGKTLFGGYVEGDKIDRPLDAGGWFHTRDLGAIDADGYLHVRGRKDNLFISGGENVQPEEIEGALCRLEGVEEAIVVPIPDETFGFRPVAFVKTANENVPPRDLAKALEPVLPRFKIPVAFHEWPEKTGGMKVDRASFRERAYRLHRDSPG